MEFIPSSTMNCDLVRGVSKLFTPRAAPAIQQQVLGLVPTRGLSKKNETRYVVLSYIFLHRKSCLRGPNEKFLRAASGPRA